MATPWLAILKRVPWSEVISHAPGVADGAKKLWSNISRRSASTVSEGEINNPALSPEERNLATLQAQLVAIRGAVTELQAEMLTSSELIKALADQNAQLIERLNSLRRWMRWIGLTAAIALTTTAYLLASSLKA